MHARSAGSRVGSRGSTLVEAAVALVLLGTVVAVSWIAVAVSGRAALSGRTFVLARVELASFDERLRDGATRVRVPMWSADSGYLSIGSASARVRYLDGLPEAALELDSGEGGVTLRLPEAEMRFPRLRLLELSPAVTDDGGVYGLHLEVGGVGSLPQRLIVAFGALPW